MVTQDQAQEPAASLDLWAGVPIDKVRKIIERESHEAKLMAQRMASFVA